ncbi:MAG TPA: hypothetical protein VGI81_21680 [Tepidisphaeraceae bacterium]
MASPDPHPLDYARPTRESHSDRETWRLWPIPALLIPAAILSISAVRMIPGGPFISIHANVVPCVLCVLAIYLTVRAMKNVRHRAGPVLALIMAGGIICFVVADVIAFWLHPSARGILVGL